MFRNLEVLRNETRKLSLKMRRPWSLPRLVATGEPFGGEKYDSSIKFKIISALLHHETRLQRPPLVTTTEVPSTLDELKTCSLALGFPLAL